MWRLSHRNAPRLLLGALLICAPWAGYAAAQDGQPGEVSLTIGPSWAVVREVREVAFTGAEQVVVFELPQEADLSSLNIVSSRGAVGLISWERESRRIPVSAATRARVAPGGRGMVFSAPVADNQASASERVSCRLSTTLPRTRPVELMYRLRGLGWHCHYEITIRGDIANYLEAIALDMDGRVVISNGTSRSFRHAQIVLVGEDPGTATRVASTSLDPGILMLDDESPMADTWRHHAPAPAVPYRYTLANPVDVAALGETSALLVAARRKPADRLYSMDSDNFPVDARGPWRPLTRYLTFRNEPSYGLGQALPPGPALIYLGAVRGALYQRAWIGHTPAGAEMRINLGTTEGVTAVRRSEGRRMSSAGFHEETMTLQLANVLPSAINIEVVERPPVPLAWEVTRSSRPYERAAGRLTFKLQMAARSETETIYTVRLTEPEM